MGIVWPYSEYGYNNTFKHLLIPLIFCVKPNIKYLPLVSSLISDIPNSDSESFNPALWEEQRKHRAQVAFECDEDKDERETPPRVSGKLVLYLPQIVAVFYQQQLSVLVWIATRVPFSQRSGRELGAFLSVGNVITFFFSDQEGNLKRYPTPYPDELKNMVKTAQSVAHRLKEDESSDESGKDGKPVERNHIGVQDVGVKVSCS